MRHCTSRAGGRVVYASFPGVQHKRGRVVTLLLGSWATTLRPQGPHPLSPQKPRATFLSFSFFHLKFGIQRGQLPLLSLGHPTHTYVVALSDAGDTAESLRNNVPVLTRLRSIDKRKCRWQPSQVRLLGACCGLDRRCPPEGHIGGNATVFRGDMIWF